MKTTLIITLLLMLFVSTAGVAKNNMERDDILKRVLSIQELNDHRLVELESLDRVRDRFLKEIILRESLIEVIVNGVSTRAACSADCGNEESVTCSGDFCDAIDGVGCSGTAIDGTVIKSCEIIITD